MLKDVYEAVPGQTWLHKFGHLNNLAAIAGHDEPKQTTWVDKRPSYDGAAEEARVLGANDLGLWGCIKLATKIVVVFGTVGLGVLSAMVAGAAHILGHNWYEPFVLLAHWVF